MTGPRSLWRPSLLLKITAALALCLLVANLVTSLVEDRLTRSALDRQSSRLAASELRVLTDAYLERSESLADAVRSLAGELARRNLTDPTRRADLNVELGLSHRNRRLDLLEIIDTGGERPVPPAGIITVADPIDIGREPDAGSAGRLLRTTEGTWVQVAVAPIGTAAPRLLLVGGYEFGDAFAYQLRRQIGDLGEVILVAGGQLAGSTLAVPPAAPPAAGPQQRIPTEPEAVPVGDEQVLVAYQPIARGAAGNHAGAVGVAFADPTAGLDRSLTHNRLVVSIVLAGVALAVGWLLFRALIRPLRALAVTAGRIAAGDREASFSAKGSDEISGLASSLAEMTAELQRQSAGLAESARRILTAQAEERNRIERDLHDGAQQRLLSASLALGRARANPAAQSDDVLAGSLDESARQLDRAMSELRALARGIHPAVLSQDGLRGALESLAEGAAVPAEVVATGERFSAPVEATAYFVAAEGLANATKHAPSSTVRMSATRRGDRLVVEVSDDGAGGADPALGSGLVGLSDRVSALGGTFVLDSPRGGGTCLRAELPFE